MKASEETSPLAAGHRDADPDHAYVASTAPTSRVTTTRCSRQGSNKISKPGLETKTLTHNFPNFQN
eukprot:404296-Amphidinium_carterae.1